jgi:hypothetical protein
LLQYFAKDYTGTLAGLSLIYFRNVWGEREKKIFRYTTGVFLAVAESSWHSWAAAGTLNAIFELSPSDLQKITGGTEARIKA